MIVGEGVMVEMEVKVGVDVRVGKFPHEGNLNVPTRVCQSVPVVR